MPRLMSLALAATVAFAVAFQLASAACTSGLAMLYRFEADAMIGKDSCGRLDLDQIGSAGTALSLMTVADAGADGIVPADSTKVLKFADGSGHALAKTANLPSEFVSTNDFTVAFWFRRSVTAVRDAAVITTWGDDGTGQQFGLYANQGSDPPFPDYDRINSWASDVSSSSSAMHGSAIDKADHYSFNHFAWVHTTADDHMKLYVNGVLERDLGGTTFTHFRGQVAQKNLFVGTHRTAGTVYVAEGEIDDLGFWGSALDANTILTKVMDGDYQQWGLAPGSEDDPHFAGFRGQKYDVTGEENVPYIWYSDVDVTISGQMTRNAEDNKIYQTAAAMRFGDGSTVLFQPSPNYKFEISPFNANHTLGDCGRVFWADPRTAVIQWHTYTITLQTARPIQGSPDLHHINFGMSSVARNPDSVSGLLGDSHRPGTPVEGALHGEGVLEADLSAYVLRDGLFGTDSKMNRFAGAAGALTAAQCRALQASPKTLSSTVAGSAEGTN